MGMFSSLFGSAGSDKSDQLRQQALDAFNAVKTPELSSLQVQLQNSVLAGKITPEQAETTLLNSNAFNQIKTDPSLMGAQKQALQALQDTASQGGLTAIDKAQLQDITDQQEQENKSNNDAVMANARARGVGNSNSALVSKLINNQGSADRAATSGLGVAAQAQARALQAIQAAGGQGAQMQQTQFNQGAQTAAAQNAIDQFNATNTNATNKMNVANNLTAQEQNLAAGQHVNDENTATQNEATLNNANANQTIYNDQLQKAQGIAGVDQNWANTAQQTQNAETAGNVGITAGLINAGAKAAGPIAGAVSSATTPSTSSPDEMAPAGYNPNKAANQDAVLGYSEGGTVKPSSIEDEYHKFVQTFCNGGTVNMADGGRVTVKPGKKINPMPQMPMDNRPTPLLPITSAPNGVDWQLSDPKNEPIGQFSNYSDAADYAAKVRAKQPMVHDFRDGGKVPGIAPVPGDSPKNDIVPAKLSPDEVVASRTEAQNFEKKTGTPLEEALKRLKNPPYPTQTASVRG